MANISTDQKEDLHVYASDNILSQINNLVSNRDKVRKTKMKQAQKLWLDPYRETWKPPYQYLVPEVMIYLTAC